MKKQGRTNIKTIQKKKYLSSQKECIHPLPYNNYHRCFCTVYKLRVCEYWRQVINLWKSTGHWSLNPIFSMFSTILIFGLLQARGISHLEGRTWFIREQRFSFSSYQLALASLQYHPAFFHWIYVIQEDVFGWTNCNPFFISTRFIILDKSAAHWISCVGNGTEGCAFFIFLPVKLVAIYKIYSNKPVPFCGSRLPALFSFRVI